MRTRTIGALGVLLTLICGAASPATQPAAPHGAFQAVGNMTTAHADPTVTLLKDGTALVVGGIHSDGTNLVSQTAAEQFDPTTNTFAVVGSMAYSRHRHAAVRLADGRVLVVGGTDAQNVRDPTAPEDWIPATEIYDPTTAKFSTVGDLINKRADLTATLLPNGRVLVVGGFREDHPPFAWETAELFDPATGKFEATGSMASPRTSHAAVAISDGRVVILGGYDGQLQPQRSVEIYDPQTGAFAPAGQLGEARAEFQATLLPDGKILVTGGANTHDPPGPASNRGTILSSVEIYDPATGQSVVTDNMAQSRFNHGAAALADGRVLVAGGQQSVSAITTTAAELIDPVTGKVSPTGSMTLQRPQIAMVTLPDGRVLVLGGRTAKPAAEVYVP